MAITSSNVSPGDTVLASQHNSIVTDLGSLDTDRGLNNTHRGLTNNPHTVTKTQVSLGSVENYGIASQAEAEAGTSNVKYMTPLRAKEAIGALSGGENFYLRKTGDQSIVTNTHTDITWQTETVDTDGFHSSTNAEITIPAGLGGIYLINVHASLAASAAKWVMGLWDGSAYVFQSSNNGNSDVLTIDFSWIIALSATDELKVRAYQTSGGPLDLYGGTDGLDSYFSGIRLFPS